MFLKALCNAMTLTAIFYLNYNGSVAELIVRPCWYGITSKENLSLALHGLESNRHCSAIKAKEAEFNQRPA